MKWSVDENKCIGACANALGINLLIFEKHANKYISITQCHHLFVREVIVPLHYIYIFNLTHQKKSNNLDAHSDTIPVLLTSNIGRITKQQFNPKWLSAGM